MKEPISKKEPVHVIEETVDALLAAGTPATIIDPLAGVPEFIDKIAEVKAVMGIRPIPPTDEDGWRECAREDCGSRFKPDMPSRCFCCDECATIMFYREHGMSKRAALMAAEHVENKLNDRATGRGVPNAAAEAVRTTRYGPLRTVTSVISTTKGRSQVKLSDCEHVVSIKEGTTRARCRKCRNAATVPADASAHETGVDAAPPPKREPVKVVPLREPVAKKVERVKKAVVAAAEKAAKRILKKPVARKQPVKRTKRKPVKRGKR
jgi:hypothetical protein